MRDTYDKVRAMVFPRITPSRVSVAVALGLTMLLVACAHAQDPNAQGPRFEIFVVPEPQGPDLAALIFAASPYKAALVCWGKTPPSVMDVSENLSYTPTCKADKVGPHYFRILLDQAQIQETPGNWAYRGGAQYIRRALRIPYQYYKRTEASPTVAVLITDYFLIGFEGGGSY